MPCCCAHLGLLEESEQAGWFLLCSTWQPVPGPHLSHRDLWKRNLLQYFSLCTHARSPFSSPFGALSGPGSNVSAFDPALLLPRLVCSQNLPPHTHTPSTTRLGSRNLKQNWNTLKRIFAAISGILGAALDSPTPQVILP